MRKVMLVEDEEFILQGIKSIVDWEELDMRVIHMAHNGEEAFLLQQEEPADIIVTDIQMPVKDGLSLLSQVRETDRRSRFIILTGYDEFEYARKAVPLDVEDYILKPIDEEKLKSVLEAADRRLSEIDRKNAGDMDGTAGWLGFLRGGLDKKEAAQYEEMFPLKPGKPYTCAGIMKIKGAGESKGLLTDVLISLQEEGCLRVVRLSPDRLLLLFPLDKQDDRAAYESAAAVQKRLEERCSASTFISLSGCFRDPGRLPECYREAVKLQRRRILDGYGVCIGVAEAAEHETEEITVDADRLRRLVLKKEIGEAASCIRELLCAGERRRGSADAVYQAAVSLAMLLQEIKGEYSLRDGRALMDLPELLERIYAADDLEELTELFCGEIAGMIDRLHGEDCQYTPVIRQIMSYVQDHYREDMNLKTLADKYNMNASYLGTLFQKETGCSFARYLSNTKNRVAKELILNTNMRINDIAREVGYPDTSYFYRKFKQCYGVSPASLRELKNY